MRYRYCKPCDEVHEIDRHWQESGQASPQIIRDIDAYQAMGVDIATGKAPRIGSRSQHREYLRRNNYVEIGNERPRPRETDYADVTPREVKETIDRIRSRN